MGPRAWSVDRQGVEGDHKITAMEKTDQGATVIRRRLREEIEWTEKNISDMRAPDLIEERRWMCGYLYAMQQVMGWMEYVQLEQRVLTKKPVELMEEAPSNDLLEACKLAEVHLAWGDCTLEHVHRILRAAIAKTEWGG